MISEARTAYRSPKAAREVETRRFCKMRNVFALLLRKLWQFGTVCVFLATLVPVFCVVWLSFFNEKILSFPPHGYTLRWYVRAWHEDQFLAGLSFSLQVALVSSTIGLVIGSAAAFALVRGKLPAHGFLNSLLMAPFAIPGVVLGTGLYIFFVQIDNAFDFQVAGTFPGLVVAHVLLTIPWTFRLVGASLAEANTSIEEAAANLGASPLTVFRRITLPLIRSGAIAAFLFSFIHSFENLELTLLLVAPGRTTLPIEMINYLEYNVDPTIAAVGTVQIVLIAFLMVAANRLTNISRISK